MALPVGQPARGIDRGEIERLTRDHLPLVHRSVARVIRRIPRKPADDDLVAAAMLGLVQAAVAFDPTRNVAFAGFASIRVRGAVLDELRRTDWASRPVRTSAKEMQAASEHLTASLGRVPTEPELADELGVSLPALQQLIGHVHRALVLSTSAGDEAGEGGEGGSPASGGADPLQRIIDLEDRRSLQAAVATLPVRHHRVVVGHYFEGMTLRELGAELGVTESRICQLCAEAVELLRSAVTGAPVVRRRRRSAATR